MSRLDARDYGFWFVRLSDRIGLGWLGGAVVVALVPYLLGLLLVAPFGDAGLYLRTPAFYIGLGGVGLVMAASVRGVEILANGLSELQEVARDPAEFHEYADEQLRVAARDRSNLVVLAGCVAVGLAVVGAALHRWHHTGVIPAGHRFRAFLVGWRAADALLPAGLALAAFAIVVALTLGTSAVLLFRNLVFAWRLRKFGYMPFPGRVRLGVRTLVTAYVWVSATWSIGVALFALFFFSDWSALNIAVVAALAVLGILTLAVPYSTFRRILDTAHEEMTALLTQGVELQDSWEQAATANWSDFATINMAIASDAPPVLTRRSAIAYGLVQVVAFASLFAKDVLQEQVSFLAKDSAPSPSGHKPQ